MPINDQIIKKLSQLTKECASHRAGQCLEQDVPCNAINNAFTIADGAINCDYFLTAVLPADKALHQQVWKEIGKGGSRFAPWVGECDPPPQQESKRTRQCSHCGKPFIPTNNRQKYCGAACSKAGKNKQQAALMRKRRK